MLTTGHIAADVFVADRENVHGDFHPGVRPGDPLTSIGIAGAAVGENDQSLRRRLSEPVGQAFERSAQQRVGISRGRGPLGGRGGSAASTGAGLAHVRAGSAGSGRRELGIDGGQAASEPEQC